MNRKTHKPLHKNEKWLKENEEFIKQKYEIEGMLRYEVAELFKISSDRMGWILDSLGIKRRTPLHKNENWLEEHKEDIKRKYEIEKLSMTEIAVIYGISTDRMRWICQALSVKIRSNSECRNLYNNKPGVKEKQKEKAKEVMNKTEVKEKTRQATIKALNRTEVKRKMSFSAKKRAKSPEGKLNIMKANENRNTPELRNKHSKVMKIIMKDKWQDVKFREKVINALNRPEVKVKQRQRSKKAFEERVRKLGWPRNKVFPIHNNDTLPICTKIDKLLSKRFAIVVKSRYAGLIGEGEDNIGTKSLDFSNKNFLPVIVVEFNEFGHDEEKDRERWLYIENKSLSKICGIDVPFLDEWRDPKILNEKKQWGIAKKIVKTIMKSGCKPIIRQPQLQLI